MKKLTESNVYSGKWISVKESVYENSAGDLVRWESVVRQNNGGGVVIIPRLVPSQRFVLVKQFKPATNGDVLGFPAGQHPNSDRDIIRELKRATGYTGSIVQKSPFMKSGSGIVNDFGRVVYMHIDETHQINRVSQQKQAASGDREVFLVNQEDIKDLILNSLKNGVSVGANLWYLFVGSEWIRLDKK
ncbi:MAG: NUDIX hydrolase [Candidatus Omnitrophica bacterium]|nr:NUDIX hydrolase [Candidatus Omnitrophota bacterium]